MEYDRPGECSPEKVETSVNVTLNSPSQDYTHPDDRTPLSYKSIKLCCFLSSPGGKTCYFLRTRLRQEKSTLELLSLNHQKGKKTKVVMD